ncbi:hypothetical protein LIER_23184 [Lithospermum erythrorhizon]|uniref:Uncharacterized protein n=1 Tax=Lithospermum erythrorhizon TaxID=34254 RepID=A0AAV3QWQ8_LITER
MASSRTTSSQTDFGKFYQLQNLSGQVLNNPKSIFGDHVTEAMAGTSTIITTSPTSPSSPGDSSPFSTNLSPEGRVSKPARRRGSGCSLCSRATVSDAGGRDISFGFGLNQQILNPTSVNAQRRQQQQQQQHQRQVHQQQQLQFNHNMFSSMNRNHDGSLP